MGQSVGRTAAGLGSGYSKVEWSDMVLFCKDISVQFFPAMNLLVSLILKTKKPWTNILAYTICLQSAHKVVLNENCRTLNFEGNSIQYFPNEIFADFDNFCAHKQP